MTDTSAMHKGKSLALWVFWGWLAFFALLVFSSPDSAGGMALWTGTRLADTASAIADRAGGDESTEGPTTIPANAGEHGYAGSGDPHQETTTTAQPNPDPPGTLITETEPSTTVTVPPTWRYGDPDQSPAPFADDQGNFVAPTQPPTTAPPPPSLPPPTMAGEEVAQP